MKYELGENPYVEMQKYDRLKKLEAEITKELVNLYSGERKDINKVLENIYETSYFHTVYTMETELQTKLGFSMIPKDQVRRSVQNPISGLTLNDRLERNRNDIIFRTREQLTQGLIQGDSVPKMARRIRDVYEGDVKKTTRIVRTEVNRVRNEGTLDSYDRARSKGVEFDVIWLATIDKRTRPTHASLDGQKADEDGLFYIGGDSAKAPGQFSSASENILCRCTTRAEFKDLEPQFRRVRGEGIVSYATYNEWYDVRIDKKEEPKKEEIIIPKFESTKEAYKSVKYTGIDKELASQIDNRFLELSNKYNIDTTDIDIKTTSSKKVFGDATSGLNKDNNNKIYSKYEIRLSNSVMKNSEILEKNKAYNVKARKSPINDRISTVNHEWIHIIDSKYAIKKDSELTKLNNDLIGKELNMSNIRSVNEFNRNLHSSNFKLSSELFEDVKSKYKVNDKQAFSKIKEELGSYAASSKAEFLAEGFSAVTTIPKKEQTEFLTFIGERIDNRIKEVF
jgi:SPP1 gp7 family putative phage head morphogenesis protein